MKFMYVLGGWEGTTTDSRILKDTLTCDDPLIIPNGELEVLGVFYIKTYIS